ncbi:hypothetical protein [Parablautia muri]|nr:hypothetical protein [Parablautia muri]
MNMTAKQIPMREMQNFPFLSGPIWPTAWITHDLIWLFEGDMMLEKDLRWNQFVENN